MGQVGRFCWFGAATLVLFGCSNQNSGRAASVTPSSVDSTEYSVIQRAASQPDRNYCRNTRDCAPPGSMELGSSPASCNTETCEGALSQVAIVELRQAAEQLQDCYEKELRRFEREKLDHQKLEGRVLVQIRIAAGQKVCSASIERSEFDLSADLQACILQKLRGISVRPDSGCVDIALPLAFVRKEVENLPEGDGGEPAPPGS